MKPRKPLNKISKAPHRRERRFVPASVLKAVKKRSGGQCECIMVAFKDGKHQAFRTLELALKSSSAGDYPLRCPLASLPVPHHLLARSQGGLHTEENLIDICYDHHFFYIANHVAECVKNGLIIPFKGYTP